MCKFLTKLITAFKLTLAELSRSSLNSIASWFQDGGTQYTGHYTIPADIFLQLVQLHCSLLQRYQHVPQGRVTRWPHTNHPALPKQDFWDGCRYVFAAGCFLNHLIQTAPQPLRIDLAAAACRLYVHHGVLR